MDGILNVLAFGIGAMCLGAALVIAFLFSISSRNIPDRNTPDSMEGCLGKVITIAIIIVAVIFFSLAVLGN